MSRMFLATVFLVAVLVCAVLAQQQAGQAELPSFGRSYGELTTDQRRLVDDWFRRFDQVMNRQTDPELAYDTLPVSVRTTFEAVTHALATTRLTGSSSASLGTALDLVAQIDNVRGKVHGARGDRQFRIYVQLAPSALDTLEQSQQFRRGMDNTVFHKGFPINYRQQGGTPSIQYSVSPDGKRADIDVDYRSARFPVALFNGHLSSSNSDVRAGNNYDRHTNRWSGLENWWRTLFGLPLKELAPSLLTVEQEAEWSETPGNKYGRIQNAVYDFLHTWLIDRKPRRALAYVSDRAMDCVGLETGEMVDREMRIYRVLRGMMAVNDQLDKPIELEDALAGVPLSSPELRAVKHRRSAQFAIYNVPTDIAASFECANRVNPENLGQLPERRYGRFYGAVFRLETPEGLGETLLTLWTKERGYWKMISFETEPEADPKAAPDLRAATEPSPPAAREFVRPPSGFVEANRNFLRQWLVKNHYEEAARYVSDRCLPCYNLYRDPEKPAARNAPEFRTALVAGLRNAGELIGRAHRLDDVIKPVASDHPQVRYIRSPDPGAYVLGSIPAYMAEARSCANQEAGMEFTDHPVTPDSYGTYFATGLQFKNIPGDPAVFYLVWRLENNVWRIVSYEILIP